MILDAFTLEHLDYWLRAGRNPTGLPDEEVKAKIIEYCQTGDPDAVKYQLEMGWTTIVNHIYKL